MKNKKGAGVAAMMTVFLGVIVALVLYQAAAGYMSQTTGTYALVNQTYTMPAVGTTIDLKGQELINTPVVINQSEVTASVPASNYTIEERVSTVDGLKRITLTSKGGNFSSSGVNVSYTYGPEGYVDSSGGRSMVLLIPILGAMAVAIFALLPALKDMTGYS